MFITVLMNMLGTFLKISVRHIVKNKLYATINVIGLAAGITCMMLAILYWQDEHSFDDFHANNANLYRIVTTAITKDGKAEPTGGTGQVQGPAFKASVPEVKSYTRVMGGAIYSDVSANNKTLHLQPLFVDDNFFDVFSFRLLHGNANTVLSDVNYVVLTESTARRFFNSTDVTGKLLSMDADPSFENLGKPLVVSGVVKDPPPNSSLQFDILLTFGFMRLSFEDNNWLNAYLGTFVVLHPQSDRTQVVKKFNDIYTHHAKGQLGKEAFDIYGFDPKITYSLQPVTDIHLNTSISSSGESGVVNTGNPLTSYMFMGIAVFILLMAAINFVNISIACSLKRMKEIGLRKIAGSSKRQIILQFLCESAILCFTAFLLSMLFLSIALPLFNTLAGKHFVAEKLAQTSLLMYFALLFTVVVLLTGLYPAYILSNFRAAEVLYNRQKLPVKISLAVRW
ncbi:ABC transporter permease [Panacibacter sp. DH6]|uniref:ABC transporter permease n=1 Tax=Panacibacter microcysteis TaxID=2793269 RepID=A0A931EBJ2_9BACT|nr:ABC transporter permease [Panacibacter microcysteis]MBG9377566.1 ABC transporter permease [Panacibacter microcysteis]